jgi:hypothetical protein
MAFDNLHLYDAGVGLDIQIVGQDNQPIDISSATAIVFNFTRPDGSTFTVNGSFLTNGADGVVQYVTQPTDLNVIGTWTLQVTVTLPGDLYHSDINIMKVLPNVLTWQTETTMTLRYMVADTAIPATYTDISLQELFLIGAHFVQTEITFPTPYKINVAKLLISPDPTLDISRDDPFIDLAILKAACIIDNNEARLAAKRAVIMRDAQKTIDMRQVSLSKIEIWKNGWCNEYETARFQYALGNVSAGAAVLGPFRLEMNWMTGPWTPNGYGVPYGGGMYSYSNRGGDGLARDGRYR